MERLAGRRNMLHAPAEAWRPPLFTPERTGWDRLVASLRRLLDLQAGSIWRDLSVLLPQCRGTVLDVGCGAQPYRGLLSPETRYLGIDIAASRERFGYEMPETVYYEGSTWPIDTGVIDTVLATETLEHVLDPRQFLREARRCLKPYGQLILTVPFAARWHYIPYDYWRYTPSALEALLREAGFADIEVYARGNEITVACYKVMSLIFPLLFAPSHGAARFARRICGVLLLPLLVPLAVVAAVSLRGSGGDDCLGYTVVATADAVSCDLPRGAVR